MPTAGLGALVLALAVFGSGCRVERHLALVEKPRGSAFCARLASVATLVEDVIADGSVDAEERKQLIERGEICRTLRGRQDGTREERNDSECEEASTLSGSAKNCGSDKAQNGERSDGMRWTTRAVSACVMANAMRTRSIDWLGEHGPSPHRRLDGHGVSRRGSLLHTGTRDRCVRRLRVPQDRMESAGRVLRGLDRACRSHRRQQHASRARARPARGVDPESDQTLIRECRRVRLADIRSSLHRSGGSSDEVTTVAASERR